MSASEDETLIIDNMINMLDFYKSREMLKDIITETKLLHSPVFSKESNNQIYIKPENLQITGAFKIRGVFNKVSKLSLKER